MRDHETRLVKLYWAMKQRAQLQRAAAKVEAAKEAADKMISQIELGMMLNGVDYAEGEWARRHAQRVLSGVVPPEYCQARWDAVLADVKAVLSQPPT